MKISQFLAVRPILAVTEVQTEEKIIQERSKNELAFSLLAWPTARQLCETRVESRQGVDATCRIELCVNRVMVV